MALVYKRCGDFGQNTLSLVLQITHFLSKEIGLHDIEITSHSKFICVRYYSVNKNVLKVFDNCLGANSFIPV